MLPTTILLSISLVMNRNSLLQGRMRRHSVAGFWGPTNGVATISNKTPLDQLREAVNSREMLTWPAVRPIAMNYTHEHINRSDLLKLWTTGANISRGVITKQRSTNERKALWLPFAKSSIRGKKEKRSQGSCSTLSADATEKKSHTIGNTSVFRGPWGERGPSRHPPQ